MQQMVTPVTLLHSRLKISIQNCYMRSLNYRVLSQAKAQSKVLVTVLLQLWVKSIPKAPNLSNVYITSIEIAF